MKKFAPRYITADDIIISKMPALHHSHEGQPFTRERSEVLHWIIANTTAESLTEAEKLFRRGVAIGALSFSGWHKTWQGTQLFYCRIQNPTTK